MSKPVHKRDRRMHTGRRSEDLVIARLKRLHGRNARIEPSLLLAGIKNINDFDLAILMREGNPVGVRDFVAKISEGREPCTVPDFYTASLEFLLSKRQYGFVADVCQSAARAKVKHKAPYMMAIRSLLSTSYVDGSGTSFVNYEQVEAVSNIIGYIADHNRLATRPNRIGIPDIYEAAIGYLAPHEVPEGGVERKVELLTEFYGQAHEAEVSAVRCARMFEAVFKLIRDNKTAEPELKAKCMFEIAERSINSDEPYHPEFESIKEALIKCGMATKARRISAMQHSHEKDRSANGKKSQ